MRAIHHSIYGLEAVATCLQYYGLRRRSRADLVFWNDPFQIGVVTGTKLTSIVVISMAATIIKILGITSNVISKGELLGGGSCGNETLPSLEYSSHKVLPSAAASSAWIKKLELWEVIGRKVKARCRAGGEAARLMNLLVGFHRGVILWDSLVWVRIQMRKNIWDSFLFDFESNDSTGQICTYLYMTDQYSPFMHCMCSTSSWPFWK